jgi:hypothetical protein
MENNMKVFVLVRSICNPADSLDYEIDSIIGVYADENEVKDRATYLNNNADKAGFTKVLYYGDDYEVIE